MAIRDYAFGFFVGRGWTPEQAAGIVGNLAHESYNAKTKTHLDPLVKGDSGRALGVAQWQSARQKLLFEQAKKHSDDPYKRWFQFWFVDWELRNTEKTAGNKLKKAKTVEESTEIVCRYYERPSVPHLDKRIAQARHVYKRV